ncbi:hypothetical protein ACIP8U_23765 [Streptomyces pseudovenezuelae]|uniref:hypothetical protein n=1 Tax=Streptomyces pseudovenezuelae TaxID=67350 RepID=UPI00382C2B68
MKAAMRLSAQPPKHHRFPDHPAQSPLSQARDRALHLDLAFLVPNALCFGTAVTLIALSGDLLATRLFSTDMTVGLSLYLLQAVALLATAHRFDRRSARLLDPLQHERAEANATAMPVQQIGGFR